jgi:proline iminopeptidase
MPLTALAHSRARTDDGVDLWTARSGVGTRAVVLCHGGPGSWDQMEPVAEMLDDLAVVIRWDQRGCGRSEGNGPYTYERFIADLDTVRRHWQLNSFVVGGHSGGASLALFYAASHPDRTAGVIYISGTGLSWTDKHSHAYRQNRLAHLGTHRDRWEQLRRSTELDESERRELTLLTFATDFGDVTPHTLELARRWLDERFDVNRDCNTELGREMGERERWVAGRLGNIKCPVLVPRSTRPEASDRRRTARRKASQRIDGAPRRGRPCAMGRPSRTSASRAALVSQATRCMNDYRPATGPVRERSGRLCAVTTALRAACPGVTTPRPNRSRATCRSRRRSRSRRQFARALRQRDRTTGRDRRWCRRSLTDGAVRRRGRPAPSG